jgi:hypothetical protein
MINVTLAVAEYEKKNNELPEGVASLGLGVSTLTDPWGNAYQYKLVNADPGFDVISSGVDGKFETEDDMKMSGLDKIWEAAFASFGSKMEELGEKLDSLEGTNVRFDRYNNCQITRTRTASVYATNDPSERYRKAAIEAVDEQAQAAPAIEVEVEADSDDSN